MQNHQYAEPRTHLKTLLHYFPSSPPRWVLLLITVALTFFVAGCTLPGLAPEQATTMARLTQEGGTPTPTLAPQTIPVIAIAPNIGEPGTTINVSGAGWQPNAQITLNLEAQQENLKHTLTLATFTADAQGQFSTSFVYPTDEAFTLASSVQVTAFSATGQSASAAINLPGAPPTPVATPTPTESPTLTATPTPVTVNLPIVESGATSTPTTRATPAPIATITPAATTRPAYLGYVTSSALNLRIGPAVDYDVVRAIRRGTPLTVLGQNTGGSWLYVQLDDGTEGWVARSFTDYNLAAPVIATPPLPVEIIATATPTWTPLPWPTPVVINAWRGEYYDNTSLTGAIRLVRNDDAIDFRWGNGAPATGLPADNFSVRWTRSLHFDSGRYRFHAVMDDGMSVYVDGALVINEWRNGNVREATTDLSLGWGQHTLRVDYYESGGEARASLWWERISETTDYFPDWKGEYWSNRWLDGSPNVTRNDVNINFNWGENAPASSLPSDSFSARWTRWVNFDSGVYRFSARADDGIRFYLDSALRIDQWHENEANTVYTVDVTLEGGHWLEVKYYEQSGGAIAEFWWQRLSTVPTATPYATSTWTPVPTATPTWTPTATKPSTPTSTATTPVAYANVQPSGGSANSAITANGGGFPANTTVQLYLATLVRASQASPEIKSYATAQTDRNGNYTLAFVMPAQWPDGTTIEPGQIVIVVATNNFAMQASTLFDYFLPPPTVAANPYARIEPSSGQAGTVVTVNGGGFPANTTLNAHLATLAEAGAARPGLYRYATTTTDGNGNYAMSFTMPDKWPDGTPIAASQLVVLVATNDLSSQTSALFDYYVTKFTPTLNLQPTSGGPGTQINVSGGGFPANTTVNLHLGRFDAQGGAGNAQRYATATTNAAGNYVMALTLPATWPDGSSIASESLLLLVATDDYGIQVSTAFTFIAPTPTATVLPTDTPTQPPPPTETPTGTPTNTPVSLDAQIDTPVPPDTPTDTPVPPPPPDTPTDTPTDTPVPPPPPDTPTDTPVPPPPLDTPTDTPVPPPSDDDDVADVAASRIQVTLAPDEDKTQVTIKGNGFPASTRVQVYLRSFADPITNPAEMQPYTSAKTDSHGTYAIFFVMPDAWPGGVAIEPGRVRIIVAQPDTSVQASAVFHYQPLLSPAYSEPAYGPR